VPVFFTLDAGANVHLIYPVEFQENVLSMIENELLVYCENEQYLCDRIGRGPEMPKS
jgi:diphosphomevalonate decarboxylase